MAEADDDAVTPTELDEDSQEQSRVTKQTHHKPSAHDHVHMPVAPTWYIPALIESQLSISMQLTFVRLHLNLACPLWFS